MSTTSMANDEPATPKPRRTMILLIGGRQMPTFFAMRSWRPDHVVPVHTPESKVTYEDARKALEVAFPNVSWAEPLQIRGDDHISIWETLRARLVALAAHVDALAVHITGAPQLWTVGAMRACLEVGVQHVDVLHVDTRAGQIVRPLQDARDTGESFKVSCKEYLGLYGATLNKVRAKPVEPAEQVASWIAYNYPAHRKALEKWREDKSSGTTIQKYQPHGMPALYREHLGELAKTEGIDNFLKGGWLETYVYSVLIKTKYQGQPMFDDILLDPTYTIAGAERNVDVFATRGGIAAAFECKTGESAKDHGPVTQLSGATQPIGNRFVHRFVVIDLPQSEVPALVNAGKAQSTVVICSNNLQNIPAIVQQEFGLNPKNPPIYSPL